MSLRVLAAAIAQCLGPHEMSLKSSWSKWLIWLVSWCWLWCQFNHHQMKSIGYSLAAVCKFNSMCGVELRAATYALFYILCIQDGAFRSSQQYWKGVLGETRTWRPRSVSHWLWDFLRAWIWTSLWCLVELMGRQRSVYPMLLHRYICKGSAVCLFAVPHLSPDCDTSLHTASSCSGKDSCSQGKEAEEWTTKKSTWQNKAVMQTLGQNRYCECGKDREVVGKGRVQILFRTCINGQGKWVAMGRRGEGGPEMLSGDDYKSKATVLCAKERQCLMYLT